MSKPENILAILLVVIMATFKPGRAVIITVGVLTLAYKVAEFLDPNLSDENEDDE